MFYSAVQDEVLWYAEKVIYIYRMNNAFYVKVQLLMPWFFLIAMHNAVNFSLKLRNCILTDQQYEFLSRL